MDTDGRFSSAYAGSLRDLADLLDLYAKKTGTSGIPLLSDLSLLLGKDSEASYESAEKRRECLDRYMQKVSSAVSGEKTVWEISEICGRLRLMSSSLIRLIRENEWIKDPEGGAGWFNSYYDNSGRQVEGVKEFSGKKQVRMMLTGQVKRAPFP